VLPALIAAVVIVGPLPQVRKSYIFSEYAQPAHLNRDIGEWVGSLQSGPTRIMGFSMPLSYHAGARQHLSFPYCDGDVAIRYLSAAKVDYVILHRGERFTKYYDQWLTSGIPDRRAELLKLPPAFNSADLSIYRWHWRDADTAKNDGQSGN